MSGTVSFHNGATAGVSQLSVGRIAPLAVNGTWLLTPNQVTVSITRVQFCTAEGDCSDGTISNCEVTFNFASTALSKALDCDIGYPVGTFNKVTIITSKTAQVLISDATNGIYSDSATGDLSGSAPGGGAGFIPVTAQSGGVTDYQVNGFLAEPVTIAEGSVPSLVITGDLTHTVLATVAGGNPTLTQSFDVQQLPVDLLPSINSPGRIAFYSSYNTAASVRREAVGGTHAEVRLYYDSAGTPRAVFLESGNIGGAMSGCGAGSYQSQGYAADPTDTTGAYRPGGYLGKDIANVIAWARPAVSDWTSYAGVFALVAEQTVIGNTTTLRCKDVSSDPRPVSGDTYASGAPTTLPADETATVMLVQYGQ